MRTNVKGLQIKGLDTWQTFISSWYALYLPNQIVKRDIFAGLHARVPAIPGASSIQNQMTYATRLEGHHSLDVMKIMSRRTPWVPLEESLYVKLTRRTLWVRCFHEVGRPSGFNVGCTNAVWENNSFTIHARVKAAKSHHYIMKAYQKQNKTYHLINIISSVSLVLPFALRVILDNKRFAHPSSKFDGC